MKRAMPAVLVSGLMLLAPAVARSQAGAPAAVRSPAAAPIQALEQAIETRSGALLLPGGGVGTLTVTPCTGCRPLNLLAGSTTTWMLGERPVAFEEVRRALAVGPRVPVLVFYRGSDRALLRLAARAPAEARR